VQTKRSPAVLWSYGRDSTADDSTDSLFEESDNSTDKEEWLFDNEERYPPEYYLSAAANLDIDRLCQLRYSLRTQGRPDWVKEHCVKYENTQII
jgi:hypothetical protein